MQEIVNYIVRLYLVHTHINGRFGKSMQLTLIPKFSYYFSGDISIF